jgi:1,4-dihydroxy-2-naphthoate octaprenyltransferase
MMEQTRPQISTTQAWILAARPKTLPAAASPVIVGTAIAIGTKNFSLFPALAALLGALLIQIGTNFANDVFDYKKGADTHERVGPVRVVSAGILSPGQVFAGMWLTFGLATLAGIYLLIVGGWPVVVIGLLSILSGIAYTGGPFPLGYNGLGDLFVFIFFGLVAVCGTYYVQALNLVPLAWWGAIPVGLLATAIIVVNNLRDIATDAKVGKKTLAVRLGARGAQVEYFLLLGISYLIPPVMWALGVSSGWVMLSWLSLPLAFPLIKAIQTQKGRALNPVLGGTARLELIYSLLFALGLALTAL